MVEAVNRDERTFDEVKAAVLDGDGDRAADLDELLRRERITGVAMERRRVGGLVAQFGAYCERVLAASHFLARVVTKDVMMQNVLAMLDSLADDVRSGSVGGQDRAKFRALVPTAHCRRLAAGNYTVSTAGACDEFVARGTTVAEAWKVAWHRAVQWLTTGKCPVASLREVIDRARGRMFTEGWTFDERDPVFWH